MNKLFIKKQIPFFLIMIFILFFLFISIFTYVKKDYGKRRTFIFPSVDDGKYIVETRYLSENPNKSDISYYVDEILLGSGTERTKLLFTYGTKSLSCFERAGILYLNLSDLLIDMGQNVVNIEEGIDLLSENIFRNFNEINEIDIFVGNKFAYKKVKNWNG